MPALVLAGGGMRSAYTAGALRAFQEAGVRFDAVYGTSAGGAAGAWYSAGAADGFEATFDHAMDPRVLDWRRAARRRPVLDLVRLVEEVYPSLGFDPQRIRAASHPTVVTGTVVTTGATRYLDLRREPVFESLRATMALPLVAGPPVPVGGTLLVDGGVSDPLPVARALRDGHRDIWVVLNRRGNGYRREPRVASWLVGRRHPALARLAMEHHKITMAALSALDHPPDGARFHVLRPGGDTGLHRFSRDPQRLKDAIRLGQEDGSRFLAGLAGAMAA